jgi:2-(1,2-epoxy-1,2-dihydrophenyl)acetyl-CoA isomerase
MIETSRYELNDVSLIEGVLLVRFNQPDSLNALTLESMNELADLVHRAGTDPDVSVLVLTGTGRAFCAGGNAKAMGEQSEQAASAHPLDRPLWNVPSMTVEARFENKPQTGRELMLAIADLDKPTIAAVNGIAAGAGMDLALACDLRFMAASARFAQIYIRRGLIPFDGGLYWLPRLIGLSRALELMYTGDWVGAERAESIGLVNRVVSDDDLITETLAMAHRLADGPSVALQTIKHLARKSLDMTLPEMLEQTYAAVGFLFSTEDHREAMRAFLDKRDPVFQGR